MKKSVSIIAASMILACSVSTCAFAEEKQVIELGSSGLIMTIPAGYALGELTTEDTDDTQVAYYVSEESLVDFDVYQWAKAAGETLEDVAAAEAEEYGTTASAVEINDVPCMYYKALEADHGIKYSTGTYLFENGDFFAELVFWLDGETADEEVTAMVSTVMASETVEITKEGTEIVLGTSSLKITTPVVYAAGEITSEDTDESQVAYYASEESLVDFDVYQWAKAEGETLEAVAAAEAADFKAEAEAVTIGDLTVMKYNAVEESEGTEYPTVTYIAEDGSDFVEVVFWLDGEGAEEFAASIIETLTK